MSYPEPQKVRGGVVADHKHVSPEEARAAASAGVGDGTPKTAPDFEYNLDVPESSYKPTRKWIAARVTALSALFVMWVTTGSWDAEETIGLIGILTEASISYLTPNDQTPGGVPVKYD